MNRPGDSKVREAVASLFSLQNEGSGVAGVNSNLKSRTLLHQWPLSRVERLKFRSSELPNLIFKTILPPLHTELLTYQYLFAQRNRWTPLLYGTFEVGNEVWLFLEDLGDRTLNKENSVENLYRAISTLAGLHTSFESQVKTGELPSNLDLPFYDADKYRQSAVDALRTTELLVKQGKYRAVTSRHLAKLEIVVDRYSRIVSTLVQLPQTLVHGEFDADNIIFSAEDGRVVILDWSTACFGAGLLDLVDITNFAVTTFGNEMMPRVTQAYREAYRAISGTPFPVEDFEEALVSAQIEKKMSMIRWFNQCGLHYIPSGLVAYNYSVSSLIDEVFDLSTILR
ncbi:MAG: aminoglycoside phosphotransferase family protein [Chloroflexi bacterium]|uniref:Aminoglycoside phosphotransferase family protein n=1 Tax=Candidatus Chlorohelix allophototropha TaxID=3003348 RepID=A0A8T7M5Y0_9CHLR|nr:aminoglycoside phosphotransferase family protein [Chloroflexota bacterium]WJW69385.1 aminoglycoside phosphotransferase family protein [Chloroflexota bacterium L227-S17]